MKTLLLDPCCSGSRVEARGHYTAGNGFTAAAVSSQSTGQGRVWSQDGLSRIQHTILHVRLSVMIIVPISHLLTMG